MRNRTHCPDHGQTNPCPSCAADHKVGDHVGAPHRDTCRACRSDHRAAAKPDQDPAPRRARTVLDVAALAAHDDTLTHLTEV